MMQKPHKLPEGGSSTNHSGSVTGDSFDLLASEEGMVLNAFLPEVLAFIS